LLCSTVFSYNLKAQDIAIGHGKKYTIGGIKVTGTTNYNKQTVIAFTGLRKGEEIYIPGDKLSKVIKRLWDLGLFSDINFYVTDIKGDKVYLELEIVEVPELKSVTINGLKKKKHKKKLIKDNKLKPGKKVTENLIANTRKHIEDKYKSEGYLNARAKIKTEEVKDTSENKVNKVNMLIDVHRGQKVKVKSIAIEGNHVFSDGKVRRQMKTK